MEVEAIKNSTRWLEAYSNFFANLIVNDIKAMMSIAVIEGNNPIFQIVEITHRQNYPHHFTHNMTCNARFGFVVAENRL